MPASQTGGDPRKFPPHYAHNLLLFLILLNYFQSSSSVLVEPHLVKANLLDGAAFHLEMKAQFWPENFAKLPRSMKVGSVEFSETYSPRGKRAKLIQRLYGKASRKYFLAEGEPLPIKLAPQRNSGREAEEVQCEQIERQSLIDDLFEVEGGPRELATNWLTNHDDSKFPDYFLGIAQLLLIFDSNRDRLKPIRDMQRIRELQCQRYDLEWKFGRLDLILTVYLGDNTLTWNGAQLPMRIWVKTRTRGLMMVDFYSIRALPEGPRLDQLNYYVDPTTVDLGFGCYANSASEQSYPTFHEIYTMQFEVVGNENLPTRREFVAFDGRQQAFRRELIPSDGTNSLETITIYDLKQDMKFINRHKLIVPHDVVGATKASGCIGALTWLPGGLPFMPFDKFVKMGTGIVRGRQVEILEHVSKKPPELFLPVARYLNQGGGGIQSPFVATLAGCLRRAGPFSVVYYFEPQDASRHRLAIGRLLRVDLMAKGRLLAQINVYNFEWQLTNAPNGDHMDQLFRLPSSCYDEQSTKMASRSLKLELEYQSATSSSISQQVALDVLESVPVRSMGILRSLTEQLEDISLTRVTDIVSVLRENRTFGEFFKIFVNVGLALGQQISPPLQPVLATHVIIINGQRPINGVLSFEQCFYEAALRYKQTRREILFAFKDDSSCFIDSNPIYETLESDDGSSRIEFSYSNVFRFSRSTTIGHPAMRITQVGPQETSKERKPRQTASKIIDDLRSSRLIMPLVDRRNPHLLLESLLFKTDTISITDDQSRKDRRDTSLLRGLALINAKVVRTNSESDTLNQQSCRAACFSDSTCRSYSICIRDHTLDCRISEVDFDDEKLLIQLGRKRKEAAQTKRHQINLDYQPTSIKGEATRGSGHVLELLLEKRCQIYRNRAIDLFHEVSRASTRVRLDQLDQVDDVEECARLCLEENMNYFRNYQTITHSESKTTDVKLIRKNHAESLKEWCSTFRYVNIRVSPQMSDTFSGLKRDGLCQYSRGLKNRAHFDEKSNTTAIASIEMDVFEFNHVNLFMAQPNVVMKPHYPDPGSSSELTNRRRLSHMMTLEECARACFIQTTELVPYCKSFEYIIAKVPTSGAMEESTRTSVITQCAFNSMSVEDAISSGHYQDIVETRHDPSIESSNHYEPLRAYWTSAQTLDRFTGDSTSRIELDVFKTSDLLVGSVIVVIALVSGFYIGVRAAYSRQDVRQDIESELVHSIEQLTDDDLNQMSADSSPLNDR